MIYDPLNSLLFPSLIQVVVFLFLYFQSPDFTSDCQNNRNDGEIKLSSTSLPVSPRLFPVPELLSNFTCGVSAHCWMPTHVARMRLTCAVCDSHALSSSVTSCDSWLKGRSSIPVVPDQPGETLEMHRDRGNRTWWHPPSHPCHSRPPALSTPLLYSLVVSLQPPRWLQSAALQSYSLFIFWVFICLKSYSLNLCNAEVDMLNDILWKDN